jgi:hypothetical protein
MGSIVFTAGRVVPFYAEPMAGLGGEGAKPADCAESAGVAETLADVDVFCVHGEISMSVYPETDW